MCKYLRNLLRNIWKRTYFWGEKTSPEAWSNCCGRPQGGGGTTDVWGCQGTNQRLQKVCGQDTDRSTPGIQQRPLLQATRHFQRCEICPKLTQPRPNLHNTGLKKVRSVAFVIFVQRIWNIILRNISKWWNKKRIKKIISEFFGRYQLLTTCVCTHIYLITRH